MHAAPTRFDRREGDDVARLDQARFQARIELSPSFAIRRLEESCCQAMGAAGLIAAPSEDGR